MKNLNIVAALVAAFGIMSAAPAEAQKNESEGKPGKLVQERAQDVADSAEMERDELVRRDKQSRERVQDAAEDESSSHEYMGNEESGDDVGRDKSSKGKGNAAARGNEKAQEMRTRRDERKAIMEEYKANGEAGKAELGADDDALDTDIDEESEDKHKQAKKPWWKFWGQ
jgi:hypothetical protein